MKSTEALLIQVKFVDIPHLKRLLTLIGSDPATLPTEAKTTPKSEAAQPAAFSAHVETHEEGTTTFPDKSSTDAPTFVPKADYVCLPEQALTSMPSPMTPFGSSTINTDARGVATPIASHAAPWHVRSSPNTTRSTASSDSSVSHSGSFTDIDRSPRSSTIPVKFSLTPLSSVPKSYFPQDKNHAAFFDLYRPRSSATSSIIVRGSEKGSRSEFSIPKYAQKGVDVMEA